MTTADTMSRPIKKLTYTVSSDWHPFRYWQVQAESEIEARQVLAGELGLEVQELSATLGKWEEVQA